MNYYYFIFWNVLKCIQLNVLEMNHVFVCHGSLFSSRSYLEKQNYYFSPKTHHPPSLKRKNYTQLQNLPSPSPMFQLHFFKKIKKITHLHCIVSCSIWFSSFSFIEDLFNLVHEGHFLLFFLFYCIILNWDLWILEFIVVVLCLFEFLFIVFLLDDYFSSTCVEPISFKDFFF